MADGGQASTRGRSFRHSRRCSGRSLDGGEATKKRPAAVWRQTGDDSKGIRDAYRSKFIGYALPVGLQFLEWRALNPQPERA